MNENARKMHQVEIYIKVPREGPENLLYSMVRKSWEETTRDDGRKARAAVSWL